MCVLNNVKDILEIAYYVAFIILTYRIVQYAIRTYDLEASKKYELLCKITIPNPVIEYNEFPFFLEIYNAGNIVAKNVKVSVSEKLQFTIDFVKPGSYELFPLGTMGCMISNNVLLDGSTTICRGEKIEVVLNIDGKKSHHKIDTEILFASRPQDNWKREMVNQVEIIGTQLKKANEKRNSLIKEG